MPTIQYEGKGTIDFKDIFYPYAKVREGYRTQVYKDILGKDTIGIGHLITGKEPFKITPGIVLTDDQVRQLFEMDYVRLKIEGYAAEIKAAGYSYNMMLAVAHFIWMHGDGQYKTSNLRGGLLNKTFTAESIQTYLVANWDKANPKLQTKNKENFQLGFNPTPWKPPFPSTSRKG